MREPVFKHLGKKQKKNESNNSSSCLLRPRHYSECIIILTLLSIYFNSLNFSYPLFITGKLRHTG